MDWRKWIRIPLKAKGMGPYFRGSINSALALHRPNPFSQRLLPPPNLRPANLRLFNPHRLNRPLPNPRLSNLHLFKRRRRDPAPKSGRHARRLALSPTVPLWALESWWIAFDRSWQEPHNESGLLSLCRRSTLRSLSLAKTRIQISGWAARQGDQPSRIRQERWKALVSSQASYFTVQTAMRLTKC
jgi:hypothetical protein